MTKGSGTRPHLQLFTHKHTHTFKSPMVTLPKTHTLIVSGPRLSDAETPTDKPQASQDCGA